MEKSHSFLQNRYKFDEMEKQGAEYSVSEQNVLKTDANERNTPTVQRFELIN